MLTFNFRGNLFMDNSRRWDKVPYSRRAAILWAEQNAGHPTSNFNHPQEHSPPPPPVLPRPQKPVKPKRGKRKDRKGRKVQGYKHNRGSMNRQRGR